MEEQITNFSTCTCKRCMAGGCGMCPYCREGRCPLCPDCAQVLESFNTTEMTKDKSNLKWWLLCIFILIICSLICGYYGYSVWSVF